MISELAPPSSPLKLRRVTVAEYHRMIRDGYFANDERCELIDGMILEKMPKDPPHESALNRARKLIERALPPRTTVRIQSPITLPASEPEPDIVVALGDDGDYESRHPFPEDICIVIEVSDTSLLLDRGIKSDVYVRAGIAVYLIVNVAEQSIEMRSEPREGRYTKSATFTSGQRLELTLAGAPVALDVSAVFGR